MRVESLAPQLGGNLLHGRLRRRLICETSPDEAPTGFTASGVCGNWSQDLRIFLRLFEHPLKVLRFAPHVDHQSPFEIRRRNNFHRNGFF